MIFENKESFKSQLQAQAEFLYGKSLKDLTNEERFTSLSKLVMKKACDIRRDTESRYAKEQPKQVYYFSAEFLVGRFLKNYLLNLGELDNVSGYLAEMGMDLDTLCEIEADPALGNGGLGRLAACFLDSMAFLGINATGVGIRYRYGLFRQHIENGVQVEVADNWLKDYYVWENDKPKEAVTVRYGGSVHEYLNDEGKLVVEHVGGTCVSAVPYDVAIVGYGGETVNNLRLWSSRPCNEYFDLQSFNRGDYANASKERIEAESLSYVLYPDDSIEKGREMRLKQEYFFVSAGITDIIRKYKLEHGTDEWDSFPDRIAIHINDTHPAICIPELMRLLIDQEGLEWGRAWDIVVKSTSYTNHTVLPEALERWSIDMFSRLLPRIYKIIEEIDRRYKATLTGRDDISHMIQTTAILWDGQVRMANLSVIGSHSVNGVAALHSEILKADTLKDFYALTPDKFNNKTNGVSHRRFMVESNQPLTKLINSAIGTSWINDPFKLEELLKYQDDSAFLEQLAKVKRENKCRLADYISRTNHIAVDPDSIFDVQVKRIHAYKRQHLNIFKVMQLYNELKANPNADIAPTTFIFSGKAAASYILAKEIISLICTVADIINSDPDMKDKLRVVFLENYNVSLGQIVYPAANISEQISTAGKEASGTGNMKFMFNGALTLGTLDGANVEIHELVGDDNIYIFGLRAEETEALWKNGGYSAHDEYAKDERLASIIDSLTDGSLGIEHRIFNNIYGDLLYRNDEYFVLKDFDSYVKTWKQLQSDYSDLNKWNRMSLINIAKAGTFSSDRTIREYAEDIWNA